MSQLTLAKDAINTSMGAQDEEISILMSGDLQTGGISDSVKDQAFEHLPKNDTHGSAIKDSFLAQDDKLVSVDVDLGTNADQLDKLVLQ